MALGGLCLAEAAFGAADSAIARGNSAKILSLNSKCIGRISFRGFTIVRSIVIPIPGIQVLGIV